MGFQKRGLPNWNCETFIKRDIYYGGIRVFLHLDLCAIIVLFGEVQSSKQLFFDTCVIVTLMSLGFNLIVPAVVQWTYCLLHCVLWPHYIYLHV